MTNKKGMGAALTLVISIVVLITVAMALIMMTTGSVSDVSTIAKDNTNTASCNICKASKCVGGATTVTCASCPTTTITCGSASTSTETLAE